MARRKYSYHVPITIHSKKGEPEEFTYVVSAVQGDTPAQHEVLKSVNAAIIDNIWMFEDTTKLRSMITNRFPNHVEIDKGGVARDNGDPQPLYAHSSTAYRVLKALFMFGRISKEQLKLSTQVLNESHTAAVKAERKEEALDSIDQHLINGTVDTKTVRKLLKTFDDYQKTLATDKAARERAADEGEDSLLD